jgi:Ca2+-binding RTX toxin-like protein
VCSSDLRYKHDGFAADIVTYADFGDSSGENSHTWRYIALVPDRDSRHLTIDIQDILCELVDRGLISGRDYVNGYELGTEITGGKGRFDLKSLDHQLETYGASKGNDRLVGTGERDHISALAGADRIKAGAGDDRLAGGLGHDQLSGGTGKDLFVFSEFGASSDRIEDFESGADTIGLLRATFKALARGDLPAKAFDTGTIFDADTRLLYDRSSGKLFYDADGAGRNDSAHLVAILENHARLTAGDFEIL